ncbi:ketopantoate reductase family protein [Paenibacillus segetis]|uniref:2-dehydropantoate 2-reductase n=1 Tax=Paenibacillus segetis TaxID=1325360 RepID=A0ABQ1YHS9_9BACL|nr:2-dehydropantoate 2-reductase [Paenibacillus segetis]GGH26465.1 2-dehydropantoate 2-reductase [Paenibacillus segetis]
MKFEIVGAGALGLLFGAKLVEAGHEVTFWTRTLEQAELLIKDGISLGEKGGHPKVINSNKFCVYQGQAELALRKNQAADWVFITTKQRHIDEELLTLIKTLHGPKSETVCFQNGIGHLKKISMLLDGKEIHAAVTTEGATRIGAQSVIRSGVGKTTIGVVGRSSHTHLQNDENLELNGVINGESLVKILVNAGFPAFLSKDIDREIFRKLMINAVINPLTALWRIPNGELLDTDERRDLLRQLCVEGEAIYRANGILYDPALYEQILEVCRSTASNVSSMLNDVLQGAPTEVDFINGRLVEMARSKGVPAPGHEMVWRLIRGLTSTDQVRK